MRSGRAVCFVSVVAAHSVSKAATFMGLFQYNKKKFCKNTELFKRELTELAESAAVDRQTGSPLNRAVQSLDRCVYPEKADPKELKVIDKRILMLIGKVREYIASKKSMCAIEYERLLLSAIDARERGKEQYTTSELRFLDERTRLRCELYELLSRREAIEREMQELIESCSGIENTSAKFEMSSLAYDELRAEKECLDREIERIREMYNSIVETASHIQMRKTYDAIKNMTEPSEEFFRKIDEEYSKINPNNH